MKFLHAADIHLDSPLRNLALEDPEQQSRLRRATREAFSALVDRALEEGASLVLLAGDLYDHDNPNMQVVHFLRRELSRLAEGGIRVVIVRGNHDAANRISRYLDLPANTTVLSDRGPETVVLEEHGVAVTGQSFAPGPVSENLAAGFPPPVPGLFNIALLHTSLGGYAEHDPYAPCALGELLARGYDYWALGHIHKREILSREPFVVYPGNLQGRDAKETGPKGAMLCETDGHRVTSLDFVPLDVVRWHLLPVDLTGLAHPRELAAPLREGFEGILRESEGRPAAVRVTLSGRSALPASFVDRPDSVRQLVLEVAAEVSIDDLWIERVRIESPPEPPGPREIPDPDFGGILAEVLTEREGVAAALAADLAPLRRSLPEELRAPVDALPALADPESLLPRLLDFLYRTEEP